MISEWKVDYDEEDQQYYIIARKVATVRAFVGWSMKKLDQVSRHYICQPPDFSYKISTRRKHKNYKDVDGYWLHNAGHAIEKTYEAAMDFYNQSESNILGIAIDEEIAAEMSPEVVYAVELSKEDDED